MARTEFITDFRHYVFYEWMEEIYTKRTCSL